MVLDLRVISKRIPLLKAAPIISALALSAAAPAAQARIAEIGQTTVVATPSCPHSPCLAVSRTTGYQAKVGTERGLMVVPRDGRLVAWTISLGKVGPKQKAFFEKNYGGAASAGIVVLKAGAKLFSRTLAAGPAVPLEPWFGQVAQFALPRSIVVHKGEVIGLAVPTWAPALAVGLPGDTSWRASRSTKGCGDTQTQTLQAVNQITQYSCLYRTARLTYSATLVSTP